MKSVVGALLVVLATAACLGCETKEARGAADASVSTSNQVAASTKDEPTTLQERLRAGGYQIDAAMEAIERARNIVRPLALDKPPETMEALQNIADMLDSAGGTVVDLTDIPTVDEVRADFKTHDDQRLKAIEEVNDARREVDQARGIVTELIASEPPADVKTQLEQIEDAIEEALDALEEGIASYGGKVDTPTTEPSGNGG